MFRHIVERETCDPHIPADLRPYLPVLIVEEIIRYREEVPASDLFSHLCFLSVVIYAVQRPLCLEHQGILLTVKEHRLIDRILAAQDDIAPASRTNPHGLRRSQIDDPLIFPAPALKVDQKLHPEYEIIGILILYFQRISVCKLRCHELPHVPP